MLTLENLLSQTHASASFGAGVARLCQCSLWAQRILTKDVNLLDDLLQNHTQNYAIASMQQFLQAANIVDETSLKKALRQLRQRVMLRIMYRDLNGLCDLAEVLDTTTHLAEICIETTVHIYTAWLQANNHAASGASINVRANQDNISNGFIVVAMGKLGGAELNVSSDIDLIFTYDEAADWLHEMCQQDFYNQLGKKVIAALDETTADGFVFRVDMRLRPFGSEGILVPSLDALEEYYQNNGREWERYAWIKGRVVYPKAIIKLNINPSVDLQAQDLPHKVDKLLRPFIFRKYLDYNALASMRELKLQIHRDVLKKAQLDNIKLGRGGIREIEFIAQVFQLMRGGRDASLQIKPTLLVLNLLKNKGLLPNKTVADLVNAYTFLRHLEHRLMYVDDAQTQDLPMTEAAQARIALAMHFLNWQALLVQLNAHKKLVTIYFDATFNDNSTNENSIKDNKEVDGVLIVSDTTTKIDVEKAIWQNNVMKTHALQALLDAGYSDAEQTLLRLQMLRASNRYLQLPALSRLRFDALMPLVIQQAALEKNADDALLRCINLLENICRRASYLALFAEYPQALQIVVRLCAASPWLAQYLAAHPILLDELIDTETLYAAPDFAAMQQQLKLNMQALAGDIEAQMDAMRHFKHGAILRFAAQDVAGKLSLETLSDYLSALADTVLQVSIQTIWQSLSAKLKPLKQIKAPNFAVIGYGKLGGKELGYVSDLDIIFLYDKDDEDKDVEQNAADIYARFAQRINNWFNSITNAGLLYETDLQLRPDGNSGLLVSSLESFCEYQQHKAWLWEHQALTRARFVAGNADIGQRFETLRCYIMQQPRDVKETKQQVLQMREKLRIAQKLKSDLFDLKHSEGGIIDVEFMVQYMLLIHSHKHAQLTDNIGNIGLLMRLAAIKIIDLTTAKNVANAYREYRKILHASKLQAGPPVVQFSQVLKHKNAVIDCWKMVFD